ncbi:hypothetical protein TNCV_4743231 [Trichonephila clavipes]|nr:hypothetical protein TNCV_4743231 [Trichonephila clavipes]
MSALGLSLDTADHAYDDKECVMISDARAHGSTREGKMARRQHQRGLLEATDTAEGSSYGIDDTMTATSGSDVVQSGRPIFDDFFQHLWPYIGNNTANVVFQMVKRLGLSA